jgi:glycopeptide antibiotics resistance protein
MAAWRWSAVVGVLLGLVAFVVLFAPILVWQSRRFGRLTVSRTLAAGAFAIYGVTILAYTLLPLPAPDWCLTNPSKPVDLRPFHSVGDIADAVRGLSLSQALGDFTVLQVVLNVVLFVPWGAFLRRLFGRSLALTVAAGLAVSAGIELTQGTGLWGAYSCRYRVADVDDVITNTLGALVGGLVAPLVLWWVPRTSVDEPRRLEPRRVTRTRRLAAMVVDAVAFFGLWAVGTIALRLAVRWELVPPAAGRLALYDGTIPGAVALALVATPLVVGGASLGQRAMWLEASPSPSPGRCLARFAVGWGGFAALNVVESLPAVTDTATGSALSAVAAAWALLAIVAVVADPSGRGLSFRLVRLDLTDRRASAGG